MEPRRRPNREEDHPPNPPSSSSEEEYRNWLELPRDVICTILLKLGAIEILETAQKVCTLWHAICKDPLMWRSIDMRNLGDLHNMPYDLEKMAMHAVDRSCGQLVDINVEYFVTDEFLKYIADRSNHLSRLRLVCCYGEITNEGMVKEAKKLPFLEELELSYCGVSKEGLEAVGRSCPRLKSLKLNKGARQIFSSCDGEALVIAENMHELRHLQLFGNDLSNVGVKAILDGCPHLESLDLRQCFAINLDENLAKICAERIKDLRCPHDSTDDYEFDAGIHYGDYPSDLSDFDPIYDDDGLVYDDHDAENDYEFSEPSDISINGYDDLFD